MPRPTGPPPNTNSATPPAKLVEETTSSAAATDVWHFLIPYASKKTENIILLRRSQVPLLKSRPDSARYDQLACRLCPDSTICLWKNVDGQTATIRAHLQDKHWDLYSETVVALQLKGWEAVARRRVELGCTTSSGKAREPFSLDGFYTRFIKWMAVDDQSANVIESPELRDLLLYLNADLKDEDLYHRTKIAELIIKQFNIEYQKMATEIQNSLGRVSFTSDIWSRRTLQPYMAVTAHYLVSSTDERGTTLIMKTSLIAFRHIKGSHTGENLAKVFFEIIENLHISTRIGMITLDNASNNNTFMAELEKLLERKRIVFHRNGNRIRCFPHIINIVVKTGLKYLTSLDFDSDPEITNEDIAEEFAQTFGSSTAGIDGEYLRTLQTDVISLARKLVTACRASHSRREALKDIIKKGNKENWFDGQELPDVTLLRDVDTRWSSIFLMGNRLLILYPAIKIMLQQDEYKDISHHLLTPIQLRVLTDVCAFLEIFHTAQQIVSADKTPTLSVVIPIFEKLKGMLEDACFSYPNIKHAILASLTKLREYVAKAEATPIYQLSMVINPSMKFKHFENMPLALSQLKGTVFSAMMQFQHASPVSLSTGRRPVQFASPSAQAQASGRKRLNDLAKTLSAERLKASNTQQPTQTPTTSQVPSETNPQPTDVEQHHRDIVNGELDRWVKEGVLSEEDLERHPLDLVVFWKNNRVKFPLLYRLALDVLPVQASAVPCERAFSSSKETDTLRRANLEPAMMEALQILKYHYRSDRLDFLQGWMATEQECGTVIDLKRNELEDLLVAGNIEALEAVIANSYSE